MKHQLWQIKRQSRKRNIVADAVKRKTQHTLNTVVNTQLNLLRELGDLHIQLASYRNVNVQLLALILQPSLMEEPRVNEDSDPELHRVNQNLKRAKLRGGSQHLLFGASRGYQDV